MKINKKILKEALQKHKVKDRLQKLGGVERTGCLNEHLDPKDPTRVRMVESLKQWAESTHNFNEIEKEGDKIPTELCLKNIEISGNTGTATACWDSCPGGLGAAVCIGCDCYEVANSAVVSGVGPFKEPSRKGRMDETISGGGICIKNVEVSGNLGNRLSFEICGKCPCESNSGCTCIKKA